MLRAEGHKLKEEVKFLDARKEDKATKDNQIHNLKEEIAHQEELIVNLNKGKRTLGDSYRKSDEDVQAIEDKCNHLNKIKLKLEQALDKCEDSLEKEKKAKGVVEMLKRNVEEDLKITQETMSDLESVKHELNQKFQRKVKEDASIIDKIEDEQTLGNEYSKQIKELQSHFEELDEELGIECQARTKSEKNCSTLSREIKDLANMLEDSDNNTGVQIELNKKRQSELAKLKADLEKNNIFHEATLASLRQKHNNNIAEMVEQINLLNKKKAKSEKDKAYMDQDLQEVKTTLNEAMRDRANYERNSKLTQDLNVEANQKLDEINDALNEADLSQKNLQIENQKLAKQIEETDNDIAALVKSKISLTTQLDNTKRLADDEGRDRASLLEKFKSLNGEVYVHHM